MVVVGQIAKCSNTQMLKYPNAQTSRCIAHATTRIAKWVSLPKCQNAQKTCQKCPKNLCGGWSNCQMPKYPNAQTFRCIAHATTRIAKWVMRKKKTCQKCSLKKFVLSKCSKTCQNACTPMFQSGPPDECHVLAEWTCKKKQHPCQTSISWPVYERTKNHAETHIAQQTTNALSCPVLLLEQRRHTKRQLINS